MATKKEPKTGSEAAARRPPREPARTALLAALGAGDLAGRALVELTGKATSTLGGQRLQVDRAVGEMGHAVATAQHRLQDATGQVRGRVDDALAAVTRRTHSTGETTGRATEPAPDTGPETGEQTGETATRKTRRTRKTAAKTDPDPGGRTAERKPRKPPTYSHRARPWGTSRHLLYARDCVIRDGPVSQFALTCRMRYLGDSAARSAFYSRQW